MRYTITFPEHLFEQVNEHLFLDRRIEAAAYLLCSLSDSQAEKRLLVTEVIPVTGEEIEYATKYELVIKQDSYRRILKRADQLNRCFVFVHSHPEGYPKHSPQDDREELDLFRTAYARIHNEQLIHGSLVLSTPNLPMGRIWLEDGTAAPIDRIRVIGNRFRFYDYGEKTQIDVAAFDRQVLAFGEEVQKLLGKLRVGIVGMGGTGSAVCEQLTRLGIGHLMVCDPQQFESTNVNRVYGSSLNDKGVDKTKIAERNIKHIGLGTVIEVINGSITDLAVARRFRECDIIFGCTDDEWGRSVLTKLAVSYLIPVFDMGVEIDSDDGIIKSVRGRVTSLIPGSPCLFCRGIVTPDIISAEILHKLNPDEYEQRVKEGYIPGLPGNVPSVIMFTSTVAATAICEMVHRITGYMGAERNSTEVILRFDESKISTNSKQSVPDCWCSDFNSWGQGDTEPYLGLTWINS